MIPGWIFFALLAALAQAAAPLVSEHFKARALDILFGGRVLVALVTLPVVLSLPVPQDPVFYLLVVCTAAVFSASDLIYFARAIDTGAGAVTRIEGLVVGVTFILWTAITPSLLLNYFHEPLRFAGIALSLAGSVYFTLRLRRCELNARLLRSMAPMILLGALGIVFGKSAMAHAPQHSAVWYYTFLQSMLVLSIYGAIMTSRRLARYFPALAGQKALPPGRMVFAALCMGACWAVHTPAKYYAISVVENPAYVTVIGLTAPLWVMLAYRLVGRREQGDVRSGLGIVFCAFLLVVFTQL